MKFNLLGALSRWNFEKILKIERVPLIQRYAVESSEMSKNNMQKYMQLMSLSSLPQSSGPKYRCLNAINRLS